VMAATNKELLVQNQETEQREKELTLSYKGLVEQFAELDRLQGLIPICAYCKKIRQEQGTWQQLEAYLTEHSHALFSHTICPECKEREYSEFLRASAAAAP